MGYKGFASDYEEEERYQDCPSGDLPPHEEDTRQEGKGSEHQTVACGVPEISLLQPDPTCGIGGHEQKVDDDEEGAGRAEADGEDEGDRYEEGHKQDDTPPVNPARSQGVLPGSHLLAVLPIYIGVKVVVDDEGIAYHKEVGYENDDRLSRVPTGKEGPRQRK